MAVVTRELLEDALAALARDVRDPRAGILGPSSVAWRVGGDLAVFLGGGRAALLQLAHPMVAYAVDHHSSARRDIAGRFQRTFRHVFAMVFGELDDALAAARRVHRIHERVHGTIPHAIGAWPAGSAYHANDVDALRWVHATLVDTTLVVRERLDGALPAHVRDAYIAEMNRFAALFGIPHDRRPRSYAEHAAYMARMLGSDQLAVAPCAREMAKFLLGRGGPGPQPPLGRIAEAIAATMLPRHLAEQFGLPTSRRSAAGVHGLLAAFGAIYHQLPGRLVAIPARAEATRRIAGKPPARVHAWLERTLFGLSRQVTGSSQ
ncbi:MAG TPA: oxygenase MpaB family protein [Kofleriaceae bacterium]|nr:oxygenase MpaB family protein [Kofleriaceae bacterium]